MRAPATDDEEAEERALLALAGHSKPLPERRPEPLEEDARAMPQGPRRH